MRSVWGRKVAQIGHASSKMTMRRRSLASSGPQIPPAIASDSIVARTRAATVVKPSGRTASSRPLLLAPSTSRAMARPGSTTHERDRQPAGAVSRRAASASLTSCQRVCTPATTKRSALVRARRDDAATMKSAGVASSGRESANGEPELLWLFCVRRQRGPHSRLIADEE